MRKVMIVASVVLAIVQFWPMVFGSPVTPTQVAQTAAPAAIAAPTGQPKMTNLVADSNQLFTSGTSQPTGKKEQISCYRHYEIAFAACSPTDRACRMKSADQWDLCEATGLWGN